MKYATHITKPRKYADGYYYPYVDFYLDPYMIESERITLKQDLDYLDKIFERNRIRYKAARIRKYNHEYIRVYVHERDVNKVKKLDKGTLHGY
jgi:hypothetical protein